MNFNFDGQENGENMNQVPFFMQPPPNPQIFEEMMKRCGNGMQDMQMPFQWPMIPSMEFGAFRNFPMMPNVEMDNQAFPPPIVTPGSQDDLSKENTIQESKVSASNRQSSQRLQRLEKRSYNKKSTEKIKRWTNEESKRYEDFIKKYNPIMQDTTTKRMTKVFLLMSQYVQTKNPSQCRSHHQKFYPKVKRQLEKETLGKKLNPLDITRMKDEIKYLSNTFKRNCLKDLNEQECIKHVREFLQVQEKKKKKVPAIKKKNWLNIRLHKLSESQCEIVTHSRPVSENQSFLDEVKLEYDQSPLSFEESTDGMNKKSFSSPSDQDENEIMENPSQLELSEKMPYQLPQKIFDFEAMNGMNIPPVNPALNPGSVPNLPNYPMPNMFPPPILPFEPGNIEMNNEFSKFQEEFMLKEQEIMKGIMMQMNTNNGNGFREMNVNEMMNPPFGHFNNNNPNSS